LSSESRCCNEASNQVLTLAAADLERSVAFCRDGLGFPTEGIMGTEFEHGAVAFFDLESGLKLALWRRSDLARDAGMRLAEPSSTEFNLGHNVRTKAEVDTVIAQALQAGATIVKAAQETGRPCFLLVEDEFGCA
jgi:uncharacterized protein